MDSVNNSEDKLTLEDISVEVLRVLNAIKPHQADDLVEENKEVIFTKVSKRIDGASAPTREVTLNSSRNKVLLYTLSIASAIALLFIPLSQVIYTKGFNSATALLAEVPVELNVPMGTISRVTLPDGTHAVLNGGSKLIYPTLFGAERKVTLVGEGFFDVAKDENKPFYVQTNNLTAKVLGTRFGFTAYAGDSHTTLTLEEGSVYAIPSGNAPTDGVILEPSQQIVVDNTTKELTRRNVNVDEYISWKDGILIFRDMTLGEIATVLERRFNTKIRIATDELKHERYSAQFKYGENLDQVLDKLSFKRMWKYESQDGLMIAITKK